MKKSFPSESDLISLFKRHFNTERCGHVMEGIGDDCAVLKDGNGGCFLISVDTVLQRTHIPREMTAEDIGRYAVNTVLSDIAAMGGTPLGLVFSIALPGDVKEGFVNRLARSMDDAAKEHGTCIVGGDTQKADEIIITGTALGKASKERLLLRSGAKKGDLLCVTGHIGSAAAGFYCLTKGVDGGDRFIKKALRPVARISEGLLISKYASACIDISDGLALSLHEIARKSRVGFTVYEEKVPKDEELSRISKKTGVPIREMLFYKGGDYELLFTVPPEKYGSLKDDFRQLKTPLDIIGEITSANTFIISASGLKEELQEIGWQAFCG